MKNLGIRSPFTSLAAILAALTITALSALAVDGTWTSLTSGNWSDTTRWSGGTVADGEGAIANLAANFTTPITITQDGNRTLGTLNYNDSGVNPDVANLTVSHATSTLTLDAFAGYARHQHELGNNLQFEHEQLVHVPSGSREWVCVIPDVVAAMSDRRDE